MTIWYVRADCCAIAYFQLRYVEAFCLYVYARCMIFVHENSKIEYSKSSWRRAAAAAKKTNGRKGEWERKKNLTTTTECVRRPRIEQRASSHTNPNRGFTYPNCTACSFVVRAHAAAVMYCCCCCFVFFSLYLPSFPFFLSPFFFSYVISTADDSLCVSSGIREYNALSIFAFSSAALIHTYRFGCCFFSTFASLCRLCCCCCCSLSSCFHASDSHR